MFSFRFTTCVLAAGLALLALPALAQTTDSIPSSASVPTASSGTLLKLGTGFTRGLTIGGYQGTSLPLVLGAEHHLSPAVAVYANAFSGFDLGRRPRYFDGSRPSLTTEWGFDAGVKYYYNQEKRRQKGRATGPFVGNYFSLQTTSAFRSRTAYAAYDYSTLTLNWGLQRRIGKYGWFDAYIGAGVGRDQLYHYATKKAAQARYGFAPELGIKFSLGSQLTH
ncbi:hypothetical protein DNI29_14675 [Hymenobacter sediminis]|uniref:hypothetical protein n=1 Tax=Hymenobacter sediminis TaxID=2218621 RepID=UPI000DA6A351|nr:hypothetical protein [Hymenobacter sediminis]RPD46245.1 hypothetical protein DNI29_14675 [Hymenobacter sediminis]